MKKRLWTILIFCALIAAFLHHSLGSWRSFDWPRFWNELHHVRVELVGLSVLLIYIAFLLRAARWKVFLSGRSEATVARLLPPTILGFTGLTLLGRPAELIRPYLIARREGLSVSSQLGIWGMERVFDIVAFAVLMAVALLLTSSTSDLPNVDRIRHGILLATAGALIAAATAFALSRERTRPQNLRLAVGRRTPKLFAALDEMLSVVPSSTAIWKAGLLSLVMWLSIALAYYCTIHALRFPLKTFAFAEVVVLMALSLAGSLVQLPAAGGQQFAVITGLTAVFAVPSELAVNCGILLWFTTHFAPVPVGLVLLRHMGVSFRRLSKESLASSNRYPAGVTVRVDDAGGSGITSEQRHRAILRKSADSV